MVILETNKGNICVKLFADEAPSTVKNFLSYVDAGHYDGTIFHRVIPNFMIQGGGFESGMVQKQTQEPIENEAANGISNEMGTLAMARTNDPHSATCQFFININNNAFLDYKESTSQGFGYCVFAKVTDGMDIVDNIKSVDTSTQGMHQDVPVEDVVINKAYQKV